ncbi:MAG: HAMP domain-containing protein [Deltaproteobacteria bacterium]|nr:HAMP domain-containing protein [Deltaproteobacteria bacterium]
MGFATRIAAAIGSSLKLKLSLFIVTILALTVGIAPWSAIRTQEQQLQRAAQARLRALHEMLGKTIITTCMLVGERESVQRVVEVTTGHQDIRSVRLFDAHGVIKYSSDVAELGTQLSAAELTRHYGQVDPIVVREGGNVNLTLAQPLFNRPECVSCHDATHKILGVLQVSLSLDGMRAQLAVLKRSALVATLITLGVIAIGIWLSLTVLVDHPLQQLVEVMERAERGDLSVRANARKSDEIGWLARHFNDMISKLDIAQDQLERYHQEQLARADRLATIGEMAAAVAHEIRNPLTGISGVLSVLSRDFPSDDPRREVVRQTHHLIDRLNKSVEDILHYSRPSQPQLHPVKLDDIVGLALSLVQSEAKKARVHLIKQTAPGAEENGSAATVNADPYQIQQVLINLILNAIQATAAGGQVALRTEVARDNGAAGLACIEIEDTGKGMTAEEAAKAFLPFFSTKAQGTGLGLPIAKQIIEQHRGRISLRSAPGSGTCVRVELPALTPPSQET